MVFVGPALVLRRAFLNNVATILVLGDTALVDVGRRTAFPGAALATWEAQRRGSNAEDSEGDKDKSVGELHSGTVNRD